MMDRHKGTEHDTATVATVYKEQGEHTTTIFHQMDTEIQECAESIQKLNMLQESMEIHLEEQRQNICKQTEIANRKVKHEAQRLEQELNAIEQPKIEKVKEKRSRLQRQIKNIKDLKSALQNTIDICPSHEYVVQHAAIAESVTAELGKDCKAPKNLDPVIGKARFRVNSSRKLGTVPQVKKCKLVLKDELGIFWCDYNHSVAITAHGFLAVSLQFKNVIRIYRRQLDGTHKKETSITLSKKATTEKPSCVAVSVDGKFLVARTVFLEIYSFSGKCEGTFNFKPSLSGNGKSICTSIRPYRVLVEENMGVLTGGNWQK